jgi:uncharacterized protein (TIGR03083 family)
VELTRTQITEGVLAEYDGFATLLDELTPREWTAPTRCEKWEVRDIAGHVVGTALDVVAGTPGRRSPDDQARDLRDTAAGELVGEFRKAIVGIGRFLERLDEDGWASPVAGMTIGEGMVLLWYDTFLHADDVRAATGRPSEPGPGIGACLQYLESRLRRAGWGPARLALDGCTPIEFGGGGPQVSGDPMRFILAATGRSDPAELGLDETVNVYR